MNNMIILNVKCNNNNNSTAGADEHHQQFADDASPTKFVDDSERAAVSQPSGTTNTTKSPTLRTINTIIQLKKQSPKCNMVTNEQSPLLVTYKNNQKNVDSTTMINKKSINVAPVHYLHELPQADEERLEKIFNKLDRDGNGRIDVHDLSDALKDFGLSHQYAETFLQQSDKTKSGDVGLAEFIHYVREHEKNLRLQFSHLDKNRDGKVDLDELKSAFKDLGIDMDQNEAKKLLQRMDQDGSLNISYDEWRDFLLLAPSTDIHGLIKFWRHSTYLDIGEDMNVPDDFTPSEMQTGKWWRHLAAGGVAGAVSRTCTAPLDRIKVFLQVQPSKARISDSFFYMLKEGGVRSFWRGNGINVLKIAPESAIKFAAYEQVKHLIRQNENRQMAIYERFLAGACAGGISQTAIYPLEVLKTRLALRKTGQYRGILDAALKINAKEGMRSFYRGYIPNMLGIIPYAGIDLAVYETLKKKYLNQNETQQQPSFLLLLGCGSVSSTLGQVCSYPLALVRTRLQAQVVSSATELKEHTMVRVFRRIIATEGFSGLYRGITPNFIKVLPAVSISYVVYEYSSRALGVNMT